MGILNFIRGRAANEARKGNKNALARLAARRARNAKVQKPVAQNKR